MRLTACVMTKSEWTLRRSADAVLVEREEDAAIFQKPVWYTIGLRAKLHKPGGHTHASAVPWSKLTSDFRQLDSNRVDRRVASPIVRRYGTRAQLLAGRYTGHTPRLRRADDSPCRSGVEIVGLELGDQLELRSRLHEPEHRQNLARSRLQVRALKQFLAYWISRIEPAVNRNFLRERFAC